MISPLDSRYSDKLANINNIISEDKKILTYINIEICYLEHFLLNYLKKELTKDEKAAFSLIKENIRNNKEEKDKIIDFFKKQESVTKHEIKSIEYTASYILSQYNLQNFARFLHFGLTSQDLNILYYNICAIELNNSIIKELSIMESSFSSIDLNAKLPSYTHGKIAIPITVNEYFSTYKERIKNQIDQLKNGKIKFGGAVNNLFSLKLIDSKFDWNYFFLSFVNRYVRENTNFRNNFERYSSYELTSQIDYYSSIRDNMEKFKRIAIILEDMCKNIWISIHNGDFLIAVDKEQVGSSTMSHKINPIKFENAEGNLKISKALFDVFINELEISRLQRDLSDSTIMRNIAVPYAHLSLAIQNISSGIKELYVNKDSKKLDNNYQVYSEFIQLYLKIKGVDNSYELTKEIFRNNDYFNKEKMYNIISDLKLKESIRLSLAKKIGLI
jgi:adenylosuccinate lyase